MKTIKETREEKKQKANHAVWKFLKIEQAVNTFGVTAVKKAVNNWVKYQVQNARLLRQKNELEKELAEIEKKI